MPNLYNYQTEEWQTVPEEQVEDALLTGNYVFQKGSTVPVYDDQGNPARIPAEEAYDQLRYGDFTYRSYAKEIQRREENIAAKEQARLSDTQRGVLAGLSGFGRGISYGMTDVMADQLGMYSEQDKEFLRELRESHPGWDAAGDLTGNIAGLMFGGPAKVAYNLATKAGAKAGLKAGAALAAKPGLAKVGAFGARLATQGAVEGAAYEAGRLASDYSLDDPNLTVESAIARMGLSTVLGGGINTALGAAYQSGRKLAQGIANGVAKVAGAEDGKVMAKIATDALAFGKGWSKEQKNAVFQLMQDPVKAKRAIRTIENPAEMADEVMDALNKYKTISKDTSLALHDVKGKIRKVGELGKTTVDTQKLSKSLTAIDNAWEQFKKTDDMVDHAFVNGTDYFDKIDTIHAEVKNRVAKATTMAEAFDAVKSGKNMIKNLDKKLYAGTDDIKSKIYKFMDYEYKKQLINPNTFGQYANIYDNINDVTARFINKSQDVFGGGSKQQKLGLLGKEIRTNTGGKGYIVDRKKVRSWINSPERNDTSRATTEALQELQDATAALISVAKKPFDEIKNAEQRKFQDLIQGNLEQIIKAKEFVDDALQVRQMAVLSNSTESKTGARLMQGMTMGAMGGIVSPQVAAGAAMVGGILGSPATTLKVVTALRTGEYRAIRKLDASIRRFLSKNRAAVVGLQRAGRGALAYKMYDALEDRVDREAAEDKTIRMIRRVQELAQDPEEIEKLVRVSFPRTEDGSLDTLNASASNVSIRAMRFLADKAPKFDSDQMLLGEDVRLSSSQQQEFMKFSAAVQDPGILIEQIGDQSIDSETVEAVKAVYPNFYEKVRTQLLAEVSKNPKALTYQQKMQISILFDAQLTKGLQNTQLLQESSKMQMQPPQGKKPSSAPLQGLGNELTQGQKLAR